MDHVSQLGVQSGVKLGFQLGAQLGFQFGLQGAPFHDVQMKSKIIVTIGFEHFSNSNMERFAISKRPHREPKWEIKFERNTDDVDNQPRFVGNQ